MIALNRSRVAWKRVRFMLNRLEKAPPVLPAGFNAAHWIVARRGPAPVNATSLIRGMFHKISDKPQPGMGVFPAEWLESTFMPAAVRKVTSTKALHAFSLQYGEPLGDGGLRRALAHKLTGLHVPATPDQVITTVGATHALDIISRTLLRPGDPVMVEEPGWAVEFARLTALGMHLLPVPRRADGPDLEVMAKYCAVHKPKLYVSEIGRASCRERVL